MNMLVIGAIAYGILALVGGVMGYAKAKSKPSLISGIISSLLLFIAAAIALQGITIGPILARTVTGGLIVVFAIRLIKTGKFMPAGLMLAAGVCALIVML